MPETIVTVVDDSRVVIGAGGPSMVYQPPDLWKGNAACMACNLESGTALNQLRGTASGGTWTNAWYVGTNCFSAMDYDIDLTLQCRIKNVDHPLLTASVDFQGTSVAAYFIFFIRALDLAQSTGDPANLTLYVDGVEHSTRSIRPSDYAFNPNNFTPRMKVFEAFDLDPNRRHSVRIEWKHGGAPRPAVAVALDSIEFTSETTASPTEPSGSSSSTYSSGTTQSSSSSGTQGNPQAKETTKMVVAIVVPIAALLILGFAALLWLRRRRRLKMYESATDHQVQPFRLTVDTRQEPQISRTTQDPWVNPATEFQPTDISGTPPSYFESMVSSLSTAPSPSTGTSWAASPITRTSRFMPVVKERL